MTSTDSTDPTRSTNSTVSAVVDSPVGPLTLVASDDGLRAVHWSEQHLDSDSEPSPTTGSSDDHPVLAMAAEQLEEYFTGARTEFDIPLDPVGTDFQRAAWTALTTIPYGSTISYGEQAERMGDRNKARAVGAANGKNPIPIIVPCHRVVGADGSLTGFAGGVEVKRFLLAHESGQEPLPLSV